MIWDVDPVLLDLGPLRLTWYGLFFAGGFLIGVESMQRIYRREGRPIAELDRLLWYVLAGTIVGMRLTHCLVYEPEYFLRHPLEILKVWQGGYASHGGAAGLLLGVYVYCRAPGRPGYLWLLDRLTMPAVIAGASIRVGNFFNSEILGTPTQGPLGVVFARISPVPLHPVQLYEAVAYLGVWLWLWRRYRSVKPFVDGALTGRYLVGVFGARLLVEYFKEPQTQYEYALWLSVGQLLSVPFIAAGVWLLLRTRKA